MISFLISMTRLIAKDLNASSEERTEVINFLALKTAARANVSLITKARDSALLSAEITTD